MNAAAPGLDLFTCLFPLELLFRYVPTLDTRDQVH
jgi:hypothetical protein